MSKFKTEAINPNEIKFKFEATFTLGEWKKIKEALGEKDWQWPMNKLCDAIRDCTHQAEKVFIPQSKDDEANS